MRAGRAGVDRRAEGRRRGRGRGAPRRGRPQAPHRRHRPRLGRGRARRARLPRDRRPDAGRRPRVASTRSATSTAARSSPTSASTRPGSSPRTCSAARSRRSPKASARPASPSPTRRSRRSARRSPQADEAGIDARAVDVPTDGSPGASFQGKGTGGTSRLVVDRKTDTIVGATFTGFETADFLQAATVRDRRRGAAGPPAPRARPVPHAQRGLAEAAREVGSGRGLDGRAGLQVREHVRREARDLVEIVDRAEAAEALAVGEQAGRLGDREVLRRAAARR